MTENVTFDIPLAGSKKSTYKAGSLLTRIVTDTDVQVIHPAPVVLAISCANHIYGGELQYVRRKVIWNTNIVDIIYRKTKA